MQSHLSSQVIRTSAVAHRCRLLGFRIRIPFHSSLYLSPGQDSLAPMGTEFPRKDGEPPRQATDQHYIARRVEQTGAGLRLSRKRVTASRLRNSADEIRTHAHYAQASARIGESLRQAGGFGLL